MARLDEQARVREYRYYVTDCLKMIIPGGKDAVRYADLFKPSKTETRSSEEIKNDILGKLRGL